MKNRMKKTYSMKRLTDWLTFDSHLLRQTWNAIETHSIKP